MNRWEMTDFGEYDPNNEGKKAKKREEIQLELDLFLKKGGHIKEVPRAREVDPEVVRQMKSALRYYKEHKRETP